jgi:hypothetical protein
VGTSQTDRCNKGCQLLEIRLLAGFTIWLSALPHARGGDVLRVKGTVTTPAGRLPVQRVRVAMQPPEILPADHTAVDDTIVIIGHGFAAADLQRSRESFLAA